MYYVCFLESINHNRHYIGCCSDIIIRLKQHNSGETKSTKLYRPWKLIYNEVFQDKSTAFKQEWYLKHPVGYLEKVAIIKKFGEVA